MEVQEVHLPDSVEQVESMPFRGIRIKKIHLPESIKTIDIYAFSGTPLGIYRITGEFAETWAQCIPLLQDVKKAKVSNFYLVEIHMIHLMIVENCGK